MKSIKQIIKIVLMIILLLSLLSVTSKATIQGKVKADNIRLRSEANAESKILTLISINEQVEVIEKQGEWYKIEYKGDTGYIKTEFVDLEEDVLPEETKEQQPETVAPQEPTQTAEKTVAGEEKVYILPLLNSKVIETIEANTKLEVLQSVTGWSYIATEKLSGWIRSDKLVEKQVAKPQEEPKQEEEAKPEEPKELNQKAYISSNSVNLRKEPSKSAEVLDVLTINAEVTILTEEEGWYKIKVKNQTGYVAKDLVSNKKTEVSSRNADTPRQDKQEANVTPTDSASSDLGTQIANYAVGFVGYPYVYGGNTPSGFDCSGFTSYVYKQFGYSISRSSSGQVNNGVAVAKSDLQPGDLVLFKGQNSSSIGHVGIYIGGNEFVHASTAKTGVKISSLSSGSYIARYVTARRVI